MEDFKQWVLDNDELVTFNLMTDDEKRFFIKCKQNGWKPQAYNSPTFGRM